MAMQSPRRTFERDSRRAKGTVLHAAAEAHPFAGLLGTAEAQDWAAAQWPCRRIAGTMVPRPQSLEMTGSPTMPEDADTIQAYVLQFQSLALPHGRAEAIAAEFRPALKTTQAALPALAFEDEPASFEAVLAANAEIEP
jgi:hypothetical protein